MKFLLNSLVVSSIALVSTTIKAENLDKLFVVGCADSSQLCTEPSKMQAYGKRLANNYAHQINQQPANFHVVMQSDAIDAVYHYRYSIIPDYTVMEGTGGRDTQIYTPMVQVRSVSLVGEQKYLAKQLVSGYAAQEQWREALGLAIMPEPIDVEEFCKPVEGAYYSQIRGSCQLELLNSGFYDSANQIHTSTESWLFKLFGSLDIRGKAETNAILATTSVEGGVQVGAGFDFGKVNTTVTKFGKVMSFKMDTGEVLVCQPLDTGELEVVSLILPDGTSVPIEKDGTLVKEDVEQLGNGQYTFTSQSLNFVKAVSAL